MPAATSPPTGWHIYSPSSSYAKPVAQRLMCWSDRDQRIRVTSSANHGLVFSVPGELCEMHGPLPLRDAPPPAELVVCNGTPSHWMAHYPAPAQITGADINDCPFATPQEIPPAPQGFHVSYVDTNTITISWAYSCTGTFSGFNLYTRSPGSPTWNKITFGTGVRTHTLTGLAPGLHEFTMEAYAMAPHEVVSEMVGPISATTADPIIEPPAAFAVSGTPTQTAVTVTWTHSGNPPLNGFRLWHRVQGTTDWGTPQELAATARTATVSGLTAATNYEFQIQAFATVGS